MKKLSKEILKIFVVLFVLAYSLNAQIFSRHTKAALYEIAAKELSGILEKMPPGHEFDYGFNNRYEFDEAELGIPYQEYSMITMKPTGFWRIPVTVDGENRAMVKYSLVDNEWQWQGFGAVGLARELGELENNRTKKPVSGKILRDYKFTCDYIQFDAESENMIQGELIPLNTARKFLRSVTHDEFRAQYNVSEIKELRSLRLSESIK